FSDARAMRASIARAAPYAVHGQGDRSAARRCRRTGDVMTAITYSPDARQASHRRIMARTRGRVNGPVTQFISPSDLGQWLKPFVMLARYAVDETASFNYPMHPHSGIASLAVIVEGTLRSFDSNGNPKTLQRGSVELLVAGRGIWHGGQV